MTPEQLVRTSPHFEIVMHQLKKQYPYIVGYELPDNFNGKWDEYRYNFFVSLVVSKSRALELRPGWQTLFWVDAYDEFEAIFLTMIFEEKEDSDGPSPKDDEEGIDNLFEKYYNSKGVPDEIKLQKQPGVSQYILRP